MIIAPEYLKEVQKLWRRAVVASLRSGKAPDYAIRSADEVFSRYLKLFELAK